MLVLVDGYLAARPAPVLMVPGLHVDVGRWLTNGAISTAIVLVLTMAATHELVRLARARGRRPFGLTAQLFAALLVIGPYVSRNLAPVTGGVRRVSGAALARDCAGVSVSCAGGYARHGQRDGEPCDNDLHNSLWRRAGGVHDQAAHGGGGECRGRRAAVLAISSQDHGYRGVFHGPGAGADEDDPVAEPEEDVGGVCGRAGDDGCSARWGSGTGCTRWAWCGLGHAACRIRWRSCCWACCWASFRRPGTCVPRCSSVTRR